MDLPRELELPESRWNGLRRPGPREPVLPDDSWNRFAGESRPEARWPRKLAPLLATLLVAELAYAMPAYATPRPAPAVQREAPVKGAKVPVKPPLADPAAARAWTSPPRVSWPGTGRAELGGSAGARAAGDFPVRLAPAKGGTKRAADPVTVELLDPDLPGTGLLGLAMRVTPGRGASVKSGGTVRLEVDYSGFRHASGGDYASRLRMVELPECALTGATGCPAPEPVKSENHLGNGTVTAEVGTSGLYALTAAASGPSGDHGATSLSPSADWSVGPQSGDFSWGYEMDAPPALGGDEPSLSLGYSSQSVDGRTVSTNNQASWAGEGFELSPGGYIERRYKACMIDGKKTGDLCWDQDNATMFLSDSSVELIKDAATRQWRPKRDDGTRVEHLVGAANGDDNGEYWRVTTLDGDQYTFGLNRLPGWTSGKPETRSVQTVPVFGNNSGEPCHRSTPADAWCQQAYRWNLDYAADPHGNATTYWYEPEKNHYGRTMKAELGTPYVRGAYLTRIDYGYLENELFTRSPAARVVFGTAERCLPSGTVTCAPGELKKETAAHWPDVPFDRICDSGVKCTDRLSPTFFTRKRLAKVTTQILGPSGQYAPVRSWTLTHAFPASGDGMSPSLWLASIRQTGHVGGTLSLPPITFTGVQLPNRVDALEGRAPLVKWRVQAVGNESGGELRINYSAADCRPGDVPAADKNTRRCFPQRWSPPLEAEVTDWFHKYVVTQTVEVDRVAGSPAVVTDYEYLDGAGWRFAENILIKPEHRTWSDFRGFGRVRIREGDGQDTRRTLTEFRYFRGLHGDKQSDGSKRIARVEDSEGGKLDDLDQYAGIEREEIVFDGDGGEILSATAEKPWSVKTAESTQGGVTKAAHVVQPESMVTRLALPGGGWRRTGEARTYDTTGLLLSVDEQGDLAVGDDDQCTRYSYARDDSSWMLDYSSRVRTVAAGCGAGASRAAAGQVLSDERIQYDGGANGQAPTRGDVTSVQELVSEDGKTITASTRAYDVYGRQTGETDAAGTRSVIAYSPAAGAPVREVTATNQLGHAERTQLEPAWGEPVALIDENGSRTEMAYDPLGRLVKVWQADRSRAAGESPNTEYSYLTRNDGPSVITTKTLRADGGYTVSHELYDGLTRERQTQEPAPVDDQAQDPALRGGRTITDTLYNSQGRSYKSNPGYFATGEPSTELLAVADQDVPNQLVSVFDGTGEVNAQILKAKGVEKFRATAEEEGDRVHLTPPPGGTATTRIGDAEDRLIELRQYKGAAPAGEYESTTYTYTPAGQLSTVTDPAGNVWRYHYDLRGRPIRTEDPDKGVTTKTFNDADEVVTVTDARGRTLWYGYDALGRKTQMREGSATGTLLAAWTYDGLAKGELDSSVRYVAGQAYKAQINAIDAEYRTLRQTITIPAREGKLAGSYVLNTRYTLDDQVQSINFPAGGGLAEESVVYAYDGLSEPVRVTGLSAYVTATRLSKMGEILQRELGSGGKKAWITATYDEATRRMSGMRLDRAGASGSDLDLAYTYDAAGNITKIDDRAGGDTQCFSHDGMRRLTSAWTATDDCAGGPRADVIGGVAPYAVSYAYDAAGNRVKETRHARGGAAEQVRTFTYPAAGGRQPHALQTAGQDLFAYDAAGNTTRRKVGASDQTLVWDTEGNLASVTEAGRTTSFLYDADGDRLIRRTPADATLYIDDMELRFDYAGDRVEQTRYYTVDGEAVAVRTPDNQVYFLANDHHGTALAAVNAGTGEVAVRRQTPFGEARGSAPPWWPGQRGFVGGTRDDTIGLVHLGAREYDPRNGRFISVDPIVDHEDPQQLNAYAYANNSPVAASDPDGQWVHIAVIVGGVAARYAARAAYRAWLRRQAARRAAQALARRRRLEEAARRRRLAEEAARKRRAAEAARKKRLEAEKKRREAADRKRKADLARRRAALQKKRAREAAARQRRAARAQGRKAEREAKARARARAKIYRTKRSDELRKIRTRQAPVHRRGKLLYSRPTSLKANQRVSVPKLDRERPGAMPARNQQHVSYSVTYRQENGKWTQSRSPFRTEARKGTETVGSERKRGGLVAETVMRVGRQAGAGHMDDLFNLLG